ncbi:Uma2 family endonuclease [Cohnella cellulosilytica]|uniref:Uma2 family endonuclease n=1 Tax=Cohnella cellulosilytica TaxID=986710 RepID=A0ABW2FHQ0_9BACL
MANKREKDELKKQEPIVKEQTENYAYEDGGDPSFPATEKGRCEIIEGVRYAMEEERYEIIEGIRYDMQAAPTIRHQQISGAIYVMLHQTSHPNGTILYSPVDVYLDEENQFQPDLVYVLHENAAIIKPERIEGIPDLVVEILSPSTSRNDKIGKKRQFERFGLKEYWIVDPVHLTLDQFILDEHGKLQLAETYVSPQKVASPMFSCIDIDVKRVFANLL